MPTMRCTMLFFCQNTNGLSHYPLCLLAFFAKIATFSLFLLLTKKKDCRCVYLICIYLQLLFDRWTALCSNGRILASLREGGGPRSGGRSKREQEQKRHCSGRIIDSTPTRNKTKQRAIHESPLRAYYPHWSKYHKRGSNQSAGRGGAPPEYPK